MTVKIKRWQKTFLYNIYIYEIKVLQNNYEAFIYRSFYT